MALPPAAAPATPVVGAVDAPGQTASAGARMQRRAGMAALTEAAAEVSARRSAPTTRRRRERSAGQALVAVVNARLHPRDPVDLAGDAARRRAGHRGGSDFGLPNRGVDRRRAALAIRGLRPLGGAGRRPSRARGSAAPPGRTEHRADHVEVVETDRRRRAGPQRGHLPGADLEARVGQAAGASRPTSRCRARRPSAADSSARLQLSFSEARLRAAGWRSIHARSMWSLRTWMYPDVVASH